MTQPVNEIIPREIDPGVAEILNQFSEGLTELVNFGSNIMYWDLHRPNGSDEDLPAILFLRNYIEEIDAISILIKHSSVDPCKNLLRTALENLFALEYLLQDETRNRSLAYLVWNTIENNKLLTKANGRSEEYKELLKKYTRDRILKKSAPPVIQQADKLKELGEKMLVLPKFQPIKVEYDKTKARLKRNPAWYSLFNGPESILKLAERIELIALYETLYRGWSNSIHGTDIIQGKISSTVDGSAEISQIRIPKEAQSITQQCFNLSIMAFRTYILQRIPQRMNDFNHWYLSIREFNLKLGQQQLIIIE